MTSLAVRGGTVLFPQGWGISDLVLHKGRIVIGSPDVRSDGETVDGTCGPVQCSTGGAGAERAALSAAVEGEAATAARTDNLAAGGRPVTELDATGLRVVPGYVDLQCNGGYGIDLATEPERLWELGALLPRTGVTAWLPTIVTGPPEFRGRALAAWRTGPPVGAGPLARPLGLHLEGPFLARERRGAHPVEWLRAPGVSPSGAGPSAVPTPADASTSGWSRAGGVALVTLAPELPGALDLVRDLVARGVVVSAGHSSATAAEAEAAIDAGVRWVTHLFNAMVGLHHREPGLIGVALTDERVRVGLIADGVHVDRRAVALAARALGDRLTLVTDAVAAPGEAAGSAGATAGPGTSGPVTVRDRAVRLADGTLAGSVLTLDEAVRNLVAFAGVDLATAVRAATSVPAAVLGAGDRGAVVDGAVADLVLLDDAGQVVATVVGGEVAHDRRAEPAAV